MLFETMSGSCLWVMLLLVSIFYMIQTMSIQLCYTGNSLVHLYFSVNLLCRPVTNMCSIIFSWVISRSSSQAKFIKLKCIHCLKSTLLISLLNIPQAKILLKIYSNYWLVKIGFWCALHNAWVYTFVLLALSSFLFSFFWFLHIRYFRGFY